MYRLHKFRFILCKTQPFVQEISARDGESFRLAAPPQWLQKENNFLTKSVFVGFLPLQAAVKRIFPYGNTAQFPPYGLSTAPAAAARHLRCQNAR